MSALDPVAALGLSDGPPQIMRLGLPALPASTTGGASFQSVLSAGLDAVNDKVAHADELVRQFALDDSVPVHQVTIALEEARLSIELATQVRTRLVETYRELMNMQL
ncbi:flagellar hook-basal body complex protein FliE [Altererythrobacter sp. CC-YST694]|uniref:flagellar hook-basal body complex protein FliE n=1 Tax=Altererythrobacter sp. CC-YST694 TaxID=2755038 RepID=UPI001D019782|nr:flagellar hook-basal body complex protein FliE [Altererythrobacter sp. CC-YST694]MCB5423836.1 flagellar hook-basal body complex protein FliE [Altererythrobacter sp. CC-YST694]